MSRLVTEEAVHEYLSKMFDEFDISVFGNEFAGKILDSISDIPTAYDKEKVVAELEERQEKLETDMWAKESNNWYGEYCNGVSEGYENAINIVRKGGV